MLRQQLGNDSFSGFVPIGAPRPGKQIREFLAFAGRRCLIPIVSKALPSESMPTKNSCWGSKSFKGFAGSVSTITVSEEIIIKRLLKLR